MKRLAEKTGLLALYRKMRYGKAVPKKKPAHYPWTGNYENWETAKRIAGDYSNPHILEKVLPATLAVKNGEAVYERDSVLFAEPEYPEALISVLLQLADELNGELHVVDFGGSLGSTYFQTRSFLAGIKRLKWSVVEQPHFVEAGRKYISDERLGFFYTIAEVAAPKNAVILLSGVLQCLPEPYLFLQEQVLGQFNYIMVDRTGFIDQAPTRITVQRVPKEIFDANYPAWFFKEQEFLAWFSEHYQVVSAFNSFADPDVISDDGKRLYWNGYFFKLKKTYP